MSTEHWIKPEDGHPDRFDAITKTFTPGSMIHILSGTYGTRLQTFIPQHSTLRGYGKVVIESSDDRTNGNQVLTNDLNKDRDGYITIENITVDGKWDKICNQIAADQPRKLDCIALFGSHHRLTNVRVRGFGGTVATLQEGFGIIMCAHPSQHDNVIRDCYVDGSDCGDYQNAIAGGNLGTVTGCTVDNMILKASGHASGIGLSSGTISGNVIKNCVWGTYLEGARDLTIANNQYFGCLKRGIRIWIGAHNITIDNNLIEMTGGLADAICIEANEGDAQPITTTKVTRNTLRGNAQGIMLAVRAGRGQIVTGNFLDSRITENKIALDAVCFGNRTLSGGLVPSLRDRKGNWKT